MKTLNTGTVYIGWIGSRVDYRKLRGRFCKTTATTRRRAEEPRMLQILSCEQSQAVFKEPDSSCLELGCSCLRSPQWAGGPRWFAQPWRGHDGHHQPWWCHEEHHCPCHCRSAATKEAEAPRAVDPIHIDSAGLRFRWQPGQPW
jgi:hypothetical protein